MRFPKKKKKKENYEEKKITRVARGEPNIKILVQEQINPI